MLDSHLHASTLALTLGLLASPNFAGEGDEHAWPQWDGPSGTGLSAETAWVSQGKQENLWQIEVGLGYSAVVIQDGRLFTMGYDEDAGLDRILCANALTGEENWSFTYPAEIWNRSHRGGTVNTPSLDGDVLFTLNREGNAYCFDAASGEVKWHRSLNEPHGLKAGSWGFSASPLVLADQLILNCGKVLSLDKATGELNWQTRDYGDAYGTPTTFEVDGMAAIAVLNGSGAAVVSRKDGKELYFHEFSGQSRGVNAATPVPIEDALFVSSSRRGGGALLAFDGDQVVPVWENKNMANSFSGCVRIDDFLYGFDEAVLKCIDLGGEERWEVRGLGNGAVTGTPDRVLVMTEEGQLIIIRATPEGFEELSRAQIFDEGSYWTKPILVNGIIYCRSSPGVLVARDHRAPKDGE